MAQRTSFTSSSLAVFHEIAAQLLACKLPTIPWLVFESLKTYLDVPFGGEAMVKLTVVHGSKNLATFL